MAIVTINLGFRLQMSTNLAAKTTDTKCSSVSKISSNEFAITDQHQRVLYTSKFKDSKNLMWVGEKS